MAREDGGTLATRWDQAAKDIGLDLKPLIDASLLSAARQERDAARSVGLEERGLARLREFAGRIRGDERDPLVPRHVLKKDAETIAARARCIAWF